MNKELYKTRELKELLYIMLNNFYTYFDTGLCSYIFTLYHYNIISYNEGQLLHKFIIEHKPKNTWYYKNFIKAGMYYWKERKEKPRLRWIKKRIKEL